MAAALQAGAVHMTDPRHAGGVSVLGVDEAGYTLAAETAADAARLLVIDPHGATHLLPSPSGVGNHDRFAAANTPAVTTGRWVIIALQPPGGGGQPPSAFYAVNTATSTQRMITPTTLSNTNLAISPPVAVDDTVYFSATDADNGLGVGNGYVYRYQLDTASRRLLDHGQVGPVTHNGTAVSWTHGHAPITHGHMTSPPGYQHGGTQLAITGNRQAWLQNVGHGRTQARTRTGDHTPIVVVPQLHTNTDPTILALTNTYLILSDDQGLLAVDLTSGAQTRVGANTDTAAANALARGTAHTSIVNTTQLPALHC